MRTTITPNAYEQYMGFQVEFRESVLTMRCFDEAQAPLQLDPWCTQLILVSDSQDLTIRDVIFFPRHKEAAHGDPKEGAKFRALKNAYSVRVGGKEYSSLGLTLAVVGAYVAGRVRQLLGP
jgi:hypothetical protein